MPGGLHSNSYINVLYPLHTADADATKLEKTPNFRHVGVVGVDWGL